MMGRLKRRGRKGLYEVLAYGLGTAIRLPVPPSSPRNEGYGLVRVEESEKWRAVVAVPSGAQEDAAHAEVISSKQGFGMLQRGKASSGGRGMAGIGWPRARITRRTAQSMGSAAASALPSSVRPSWHS